MSAPPASADSAENQIPSTGISDCYYTQEELQYPTLSPVIKIFWNYTDESALTDEFNQSGLSSPWNLNRVIIREVGGFLNVSTHSMTGGSMFGNVIIINKETSIIHNSPTQDNPIVQYEIALGGVSIENGLGTEHPDTCVVTLDYSDPNFDHGLEAVNVDFTMTYTAPPYPDSGAGNVTFGYISAPLAESDVWGYYVKTKGMKIPDGSTNEHYLFGNRGWSDIHYSNGSASINWLNETNSSGINIASSTYSFLDQSTSIPLWVTGDGSSVSSWNNPTYYQGEFIAELVAFDRYGNQEVVATDSIDITRNYPVFETCSMDFNREDNLVEVDWNVSSYSSSYVSGAYHISIDDSILGTRELRQFSSTVNRPFSTWSDNFADFNYPLNLNSISFMTSNSNFWEHGQSYNFPLSIVHTSSDTIIAQCGVYIETDLTLDPEPEIHQADFNVDNTVTIRWNVSNYYDWYYLDENNDGAYDDLDGNGVFNQNDQLIIPHDVDSWDLCWDNQFFLEFQMDELACIDLETISDEWDDFMAWIRDVESHLVWPQHPWINLTASIPSELFCTPDCPSTVFATLVPFDQYGHNVTFGTLGVFDLVDTDGDGVPDGGDAFPNDANESADTDGDGVGDNGDVFPNDPDETEDTDEDGVGDNGDAFPNDANETTDSDGDGVGDNGDIFPSESSQWADDDGDGLGDNTSGVDGDPFLDDFDNDGVIDAEDAFPTNANETLDSDGDGIGDEEDEDDDGDGILDKAEIREGSDPKDPNSLPPESFELTLPILGVSLSAWDLMGVLSGLCLLGYIGAATLTREKRYEDYMEQIESTTSPTELDDISKRLEQLQLFRLLGVRHVLRLEQRIMDIQGTMVMMNEATLDDIPNPPSDSGGPPLDASGIINDGHEWVEWPENSGSQWYRPEGAHSDWTKL